MNRLLVLGALVPVLMTSTALAADVLQAGPVVEDAPSFTLTGTAGVVGFWLPEYDGGLFDAPDSDPLVGAMLGLSGNATIGSHDDWDVLLGFNVFGALAGGSSSSTETFSGLGTVYISGLSTPGGSSAIDLDTSVADSASADVTSPGGATNTVPIVGGPATINSSATFASGAEGFLIGGATVDDPGEMAFGAIGDESGGIFVATGDLTGLTVTTETSRSIFYTGADLTLGLGNGNYAGTAVSVYAGPSYRGFYQNAVTDITINPEEATGGAGVTLPNFSISTDENLNTHYLGGVLGGAASFGVGQGMILTLGVEGGVYGVRANWNGTDTYSTAGGNFVDAVGGVSVSQPDFSVTADEQSIDDISNDTIAFAARGNAALTWAISENQAFSLGGNIEYLSQVATVTHDRVSTPAYDSTASWSAGDTPTGAPTFSWGSMVNFGITASLTGAF